MVWLNTEHKNEGVGEGKIGGSLCTCIECQKEREEVYLNIVNKYLFYYDVVIKGWVPCPRLTSYFINVMEDLEEISVKFKCIEMSVKEFKLLESTNGSL